MPVSFRTSIFLGASSVVCFRFVLLFVMFPSLQYLCVWLVLPNSGTLVAAVRSRGAGWRHHLSSSGKTNYICRQPDLMISPNFRYALRKSALSERGVT